MPGSIVDEQPVPLVTGTPVQFHEEFQHLKKDHNSVTHDKNSANERLRKMSLNI